MIKLYTAIIASFLLLCAAGETFGQKALVTDAKRKDFAAVDEQILPAAATGQPVLG